MPADMLQARAITTRDAGRAIGARRHGGDEMPAIFYRFNGVWRCERVVTSHAVLRFSPVRIVAQDSGPSHESAETVTLMRFGPRHAWAAIVPDGFAFMHNGQPVRAGLRVLAHGDALAAESGAPVFFSTEEAPRIETFAGDESPCCPRCKSAVAGGQSVVRCPACGVLHHEHEDRRCWTYADACSLCPQPTALDAALSWSPEEL